MFIMSRLIGEVNKQLIFRNFQIDEPRGAAVSAGTNLLFGETDT